MEVRLGEFPLCSACRERNGGLVATRHRQVHLTVGEREGCVDEGLAGVLAQVWTVAGTRGSCEDDDGIAYVVPDPDASDAVATHLLSLGLDVEHRDGRLSFMLPRTAPPPGPQPDPIDAAGPVPQVLAALSAEVGVLRDRLAAATPGVEQPRIREARDRLAVAEEALELALRRSVNPLRRADNALRPAGRVIDWAMSLPVLLAVLYTAAWLVDGSVPWLVAAAVLGFVLTGAVHMWAFPRIESLASRRPVAAARSGRAASGDDHPGSSVLWPTGARLAEVRAGITTVREAAGAFLVRYLDGLGRTAPVSGAEVRRASDRDMVFAWVLFAEEALAVTADCIDLWRLAARG